ncbi:DUF2768 domain-containing protein [Saliterribacillus persicus]|uniref:Uncharacterized protein DUF2768 n=1 Tax=Saliterribacillus persicus TaxID=930114 RepID=A0A368XCF1_9BACI|nr:DUF2768 domain-containing protein [Saliterribacillus persicus]RCW64906.1 uncharacterized protein DUF2768 [Saliterribacillus persicus]
MSPALLKMYISFAGIIALFLAVGLIMLSRYKLNGFISKIVAFLAYLFLLVGGLIITYVVLSGPTPE